MIEYVPGLAGVPATESSISSIDGENGILAYRGYSIEDLVKNSSFEETSMLLLHGELPNQEELAKFRCLLQSPYDDVVIAANGSSDERVTNGNRLNGNFLSRSQGRNP